VARLVGINHVALEVGDIDEALDFYGSLFDFELRGRLRGMAFLDMGDQFLALSEGGDGEPDAGRHFGLVVDDREAVRRAVEASGVEIARTRGLRFRDPWGNNVEVVEYGDIQFLKDPEVLAALGLDGLEKTEDALRELREKGLRPAPGSPPRA
jgi:catechol 2,3-dioxygenase-like lactoylglutathione lyase family enzyme